MQKILVLIALMASLSVMAWTVSIYEVQFTSSPGSDGTYPSRFVGKTVSLDGIVTASNYRNGGYFISEALNGPWRGILILDRDAKVNPGDKVRVSGTVSEHYGMTCLQDISSTRVLGSNYPLPQPVMLTTGQLSSADEAEAYEGVHARLMNVTSVNTKSLKSKISVTDGSGACTVTTEAFSPKNSRFGKFVNQYASITGIVVYGFSEFTLGPIAGTDMVTHQPKFIQNRSWGKIKSIYK